MRLSALLVFCISLELGMSCRCKKPDYVDHFCNPDYQDVPVVAIKMLKPIKERKSKTKTRSDEVTMLAKVVYIYRQGTEVEAKKVKSSTSKPGQVQRPVDELGTSKKADSTS